MDKKELNGEFMRRLRDGWYREAERRTRREEVRD